MDDVDQKVEMYLRQRKANFVFGLVDLYGLPPHRVDLSKCDSVEEKVRTAKHSIESRVRQKNRKLFRQHFAVHEIEAWLLAYPEKWPQKIQSQISKKQPEDVNFNEPPSKFLSRLHGGRYKKTVAAKNILHTADPLVAYDKCPYLKRLLDDILKIAKRLQ